MGKVFDGNKWTNIDEDVLLRELINTNEQALENWAEDNPDHQKYIDKYNQIKERDGEAKVYKDLKYEVKRVLYDNRDMINRKA
jgi:hypothetical protein